MAERASARWRTVNRKQSAYARVRAACGKSARRKPSAAKRGNVRKRVQGSPPVGMGHAMVNGRHPSMAPRVCRYRYVFCIGGSPVRACSTWCVGMGNSTGEGCMLGKMEVAEVTLPCGRQGVRVCMVWHGRAGVVQQPKRPHVLQAEQPMRVCV